MCSDCRTQQSRRAARGQRIEETYGITLAEYDLLLAAQDNKCAICHRAPRYNLDIDHDHQIERALLNVHAPPIARRMSIRGLLCKLCNRRLLPAVRDDIVPLERAISYLRCPPAFPVLDGTE